MSSPTDFKGSVPQNYDTHLGGLFFEPYAADMVQRVMAQHPASVLEIAAGTGILSRRLREALPETTKLIATDLNMGMINHALSKAEMPLGIEWKEADAQALPFEDTSFDAVVCQFGYMFLPDKPKGLAEAFRVLKPGGKLYFNTWDRLEENGCSHTAHQFLQKQLGEKAPQFFHTPYGWCDVAAIRTMVEAAGFVGVTDEAVAKTSVAANAESVATGALMGTPVFGQLADHGVEAGNFIPVLADEIRALFGTGEVRAPMQALVFEAQKPEN